MDELRPDKCREADLAVLMLLTFLHTRPASVLLLDEPDRNLHVILQDVIYNELAFGGREARFAVDIATHSEVIINSVEPRQLCVLLDRPVCWRAWPNERAWLPR